MKNFIKAIKKILKIKPKMWTIDVWVEDCDIYVNGELINEGKNLSEIILTTRYYPKK